DIPSLTRRAPRVATSSLPEPKLHLCCARAWPDHHLLFLLSVLLMPRDQRVLARGQIRDRKSPAVAGDNEKRVIEHRQVTAHPLVHVASDFHRRIPFWPRN